MTLTIEDEMNGTRRSMGKKLLRHSERSSDLATNRRDPSRISNVELGSTLRGLSEGSRCRSCKLETVVSPRTGRCLSCELDATLMRLNRARFVKGLKPVEHIPNENYGTDTYQVEPENGKETNRP